MATRFLAAGLLVVAGVVYWGGHVLPPSGFEPLGPGAFPRALAVLLAVLALLLLFLGEFGTPETVRESGNDEAQARPQPLMAILLMVGAVGLAAIMQMRVLSFSISATVFLFVIMTILTRFNLRALPASLVIAPLTGFGLEYLFMRVFVIYLP